MCKLSMRLIAFLIACGSMFGAIPSQAQDQTPSVDIVTKPKFPLGDITKPYNPEDRGILKKPPVDISQDVCPPYNACRRHQLWRCTPGAGCGRAHCENSYHPC